MQNAERISHPERDVAITLSHGQQAALLYDQTYRRVRVKHLKAKGVLRHATVKQLITD